MNWARLASAFQKKRWPDPDENPVFCAVPWTQFYISLRGQVLPCCRSLNIEDPFAWYDGQNAEKILNNEAFRRFRLDLLNGKRREDVCGRCYFAEKHGTSQRQTVNQQFRESIPDLVKDTARNGSLGSPRLASWDVRFSNLCNLRCRTCGPVSSSSWGEELGRKSYHQSLFFEEAKFRLFLEHIQHAEYVYFAGGEPLLMEKHYELLEAMLQQGRMQLSLNYNTNLMKLRLKRWNVLELWRHFPNLRIGASLDEVGPRGEYIRSGSSWNTYKENFRAIQRECPHAKIVPTITLSIFNILRLPEIVTTLKDEGMLEQWDGFSLNYVDNPPQLQPSRLSMEARREARERLREFRRSLEEDYQVKVPKLNLAEELLSESATGSAEDSRNFVLKLDQRRKESIFDVMPDVAAALRLDPPPTSSVPIGREG